MKQVILAFAFALAFGIVGGVLFAGLVIGFVLAGATILPLGIFALIPGSLAGLGGRIGMRKDKLDLLVVMILCLSGTAVGGIVGYEIILSRFPFYPIERIDAIAIAVSFGVALKLASKPAEPTEPRTTAEEEAHEQLLGDATGSKTVDSAILPDLNVHVKNPSGLGGVPSFGYYDLFGFGSSLVFARREIGGLLPKATGTETMEELLRKDKKNFSIRKEDVKSCSLKKGVRWTTESKIFLELTGSQIVIEVNGSSTDSTRFDEAEDFLRASHLVS